MKRPKSAVLLSLPYNFQNKEEAVNIKHKVRKSLLTFQSQESICYQNSLNPYEFEKSSRSYVDSGPSLLNSTAAHYTLYQNYNQYKTINSNSPHLASSYKRYSTALSCASKSNSLKGSKITPRNLSSKQNMNSSKVFKKTQKVKCQNYFFFQPEKLKPCRLIRPKSRQSLRQCLQKSNQQTDFINKVFLNYPQPKMTNSRQILKQFQLNRSKMEPLNKQSFIIGGKSYQNNFSSGFTPICNQGVSNQFINSNKLVKKSRALLKKYN